jgi:hypothetical protein
MQRLGFIFYIKKLYRALQTNGISCRMCQVSLVQTSVKFLQIVCGVIKFTVAV